MQQGSAPSLNSEATGQTCVFCQDTHIAKYILKETPTFRVVTDHAPLVEGHLLIMPRHHYACYGAIPAELDTELFALKHEVQQFLTQYYAPVVFWEHGIFRQTVFHAHLHCFPFGEIAYDLSKDLHDLATHSQDDLRAWYTTRGQYFYLEDRRHALIFPPQMERYIRIIQEVLWPGAASRSNVVWRTPQQRQQEGGPLIETTVAKWHSFQQQEVERVS